LPGGTYSVHAHYAGDGTFAGSDSAPTTITVSPEGSTTTLSVFSVDGSGNAIPFSSRPYGTPAYLRADVSGLSGHGVASGTVLFTANGTTIGGAAVNLNTDGTAATAQGVSTITPGQKSIMAHYNGDAGFNASNSGVIPITVTQAATTIAVVPIGNNVAPGSPVTLTATVGTNSAGLRPTGTVTFLLGGTPIAGPDNPVVADGTDGSASIQNGAFTAALGTASLTTVLPTGQDIITAHYSGDANYTGSTSSPTTVNVQPDFLFAPAAPSILIPSPGGSGTVMLTVTGTTGYSGTINFSAASCSGLPRESTCSFNPTSVTNSGSTRLTISTRGAHSARLEGPAWWTTSLGVTLAGIFLLGGGAKRRSWSRLLSLMAVTCLIMIASCGGGNSGGSGGGNVDQGTPVGSSTVTVTATSGTLTHTATLTLTIQ
jgi:Bacterial Ig-like domain (group 3)